MSFSPIATRKARGNDLPKKEIKEFSDFQFPEEMSANPFRPLSVSMPNLPVEPVTTTTSDITTSMASMALTVPEPAGPKQVNHPNAAMNYPTAYPIQYTTGPVLVPHPYAPSAVIAHVVGPVTMVPAYNPFGQQNNVPTFNPFVEGNRALQQPANPFVVTQ
jgi:hypothetical protein